MDEKRRFPLYTLYFKVFRYVLVGDSKIYAGPPRRFVREKLRDEYGPIVWVQRPEPYKISDSQMVYEMSVKQALEEKREIMYVYWRGYTRGFTFAKATQRLPSGYTRMLKITVDGIVTSPVCFIQPDALVLTDEALVKATELRPGMCVFYVTDPYPLSGYFLKVKKIERSKERVYRIYTTASLISIDHLVVRGAFVGFNTIGRETAERLWRDWVKKASLGCSADADSATTSESTTSG